MSDFVFATYVATLKNTLKKRRAVETVIGELYGLVAIPDKLDGKGDRTIDCPKTTGYDIIHRKANAHEEIRAHSKDPVVVNGIDARFQRTFEKHIHESKKKVCLDGLKSLISESDLHESIKNDLLARFQYDSPWDFLSHAYLESLIPDNKLPKKGQPAVDDYVSYPKRPHLEIPISPESKEAPYIEALIEVYREDSASPDLTLDDLELKEHQERKSHFNRQRGCYYAAEEIRRGTRDVFTESEVNQFDVLKDEVYFGIDELYYENASSGYERLSRVMNQAAIIPIQKSWLGRKTDWVGTQEKKGVCHFLVNDGRIGGWVNLNE